MIILFNQIDINNNNLKNILDLIFNNIGSYKYLINNFIKIFPFEKLNNLIIQNIYIDSCFKILSLLSNSKNFPIELFENDFFSNFFFLYLNSTKINHFRRSIYFFTNILKNSNYYFNFLISNNFFEILKNNSYPFILSILLIFLNINNNFNNLINEIILKILNEKKSDYQIRILKFILEIINNNIHFNYNFILIYLNDFLNTNDENILIYCFQLINNLSIETIQFSSIIINKMIEFNNNQLYNYGFDLFIKKKNEWNGNFIDILIELIINKFDEFPFLILKKASIILINNFNLIIYNQKIIDRKSVV